MKFLVLVNHYPGEIPQYAERFVHTRVAEYIKQHECLVASFKVSGDYIFEGVPVVRLSDENHFYALLKDYRPDRILVHFALKRIIRMLKPVDIKIIVWIHGYEALGWYRRLFDVKFPDPFTWSFIRRLIGNTSQQLSLRSFIRRSNKHQSILFVFVSLWMWKTMEKDTLTRIQQRRIIPNPVEDLYFRYITKSNEQRYRILIIRPFTSPKYALDMVRDTLLGLAEDPVFEMLSITIFGQGPLWDEITRVLKPFNNIRLCNFFLNKAGMAEAFLDHGIILCPTRQDAQGVTMCEAMSCGLVPVTSKSSAIPEFVEDGYNGFTASSVNELILRIKQMVYDTDLFQRLSGNAAASIRAKAGMEDVIRKELEAITS